VPQLPQVAVLGLDLTGAVALAALIDAGLDATGVGPLDPPAGVFLAGRALVDRWVDSRKAPTADEPVDGAPADFRPVIRHARAADGTPTGFEIIVDGGSLGRWDALVVTPPALAAAGEVIAADTSWYGGVFHPRSVGVHLVGGFRDDIPQADVLAQTLASDLIWARASWVAEYLRGRYLPPPEQEMLDHPELRRTGLFRSGERGYRRALERELRAGRARAAAAGYPLPIPAVSPAR